MLYNKLYFFDLIILYISLHILADCQSQQHHIYNPYDCDLIRPDGTVYVCGETPNVPLPSTSAGIQVLDESCEKIWAVARSLSSRLAEATLEAKQSCYLPTATDSLPVIGALPVKGAFVASGHTCWGILNGPATGLAMAELIVNGNTSSVDIKAFTPLRFKSVVGGRR